MKLSLAWAQKLADADIASLPMDEIITLATERLGGIESYEDYGSRFNGVLIARVESCVKHPNADKLSLCKVDDGGVRKDVERDGDGNIQVICGAPNVRKGLTGSLDSTESRCSEHI
jgi:phenylalanyl-tRNA synthetase beta chain